MDKALTFEYAQNQVLFKRAFVRKTEIIKRAAYNSFDYKFSYELVKLAMENGNRKELHLGRLTEKTAKEVIAITNMRKRESSDSEVYWYRPNAPIETIKRSADHG